MWIAVESCLPQPRRPVLVAYRPWGARHFKLAYCVDERWYTAEGTLLQRPDAWQDVEMPNDAEMR